MSDKKIGVLGAGNMGSAIILGALNSGAFNKDEIIAFDRNEAKRRSVAEATGIVFTSSLRALAGCGLILIAVKPKDLKDILKDLSESISSETLIVSVAVGVTTRTLQDYLDGKGHVIRVMPNTPVSISSGVSALCTGIGCTDKDLEKVKELFKPLGMTIMIEESMFDAVSALSGSGPAYFLYIIEAMAAKAVSHGFDEKTALNIVMETCNGAVQLLKSTGKSAQELRREVTSPGGSTAEAIKIFEKANVSNIINDAVDAAIQRSKYMGNHDATL